MPAPTRTDAIFLACALLVASLLLGSQHCGHEYGQFVVGEVAPEDIVARDEIDVVDPSI